MYDEEKKIQCQISQTLNDLCCIKFQKSIVLFCSKPQWGVWRQLERVPACIWVGESDQELADCMSSHHPAGKEEGELCKTLLRSSQNVLGNSKQSITHYGVRGAMIFQMNTFQPVIPKFGCPDILSRPHITWVAWLAFLLRVSCAPLYTQAPQNALNTPRLIGCLKHDLRSCFEV